ncbi:MAG: phosphatidate cytidylyltransferase [Bacteroidota bacterium]
MNQNLIRRILTAVVGLGILLPVIIWSSLGLWLFCLIVSILGLWEFYQLTGFTARRYRFTAIGVAAFLWGIALMEILTAELMEIPKTSYLWGMLLLFPLLAIISLFNKQEKFPFQQLSFGIFGFFYCYLPWWLLYLVSVPSLIAPYDPWIPLGLMGLIWVLDVMAYFSGRFLGKHPLFPRISPKKTWEGAIGGAICCLLAGFLLDQQLAPEGFSWMIVAIIISVVSQIGDLVESMFKRSIDIKDSGSILPGHGGILDRFDGFFFSMPFVFLYFSLF